jgi:hypothetical protein
MLSRAAVSPRLLVSVRIHAKTPSGYRIAVVMTFGSLADSVATVLRRCMIDLKDTKPIPTKTGSPLDSSSTQNDIPITDIGGICDELKDYLRSSVGIGKSEWRGGRWNDGLISEIKIPDTVECSLLRYRVQKHSRVFTIKRNHWFYRKVSR